MATLMIPTEDVAGELEMDLEGRIEVMLDDEMQDTPDFLDCKALAMLIRGQQSYPATLTVSDAEAQQAYFAIENVIDLEDEDDDSAEVHAQVRDHLAAQGYPH